VLGKIQKTGVKERCLLGFAKKKNKKNQVLLEEINWSIEKLAQ
jgi:hypothetical protein